MSEDEEPNTDAGYKGCPYADPLGDNEEKIYEKARRCAISNRLCLNWKKRRAVDECIVKKKGGSKEVS